MPAPTSRRIPPRSRSGLALATTFPVLCLVILASTASAAHASDPADESWFRQHVQPIFKAKCQRCHAAEMRKSDLNLSTPGGIRRGGESGPILDAENPAESTLYEYVHQRLMPPEGEGELTDEEINVITRWIEAGAKMGIAPTQAEEQLSQHDVLPTLLLRCAICHGRQRTEGELDVRSMASLLAGGKSGPAIVPGKPDASLLIQKISAGEMPPRKTLAFYSVKPVTDVELDTLRKWIAAGAPEGNVAADVATSEPDPLVSDEDRRFWSFVPPRAESVPAVDAETLVRNPIDAFVLAKLEDQGLAFSPEADRRTLARRVYFDLTGLPPEPAEVEAYISDHRPGAYERLIDRALATPRYGERWGQYWLDLAGYSDSEGIQNADDVRPHAWRYRDYVIRAFNDDKPYDRFLLEQLAGDELADYGADTITPEVYDNLVATGFLRLAPDATYSPITGFVPDRLEVIDDEIEIFSSAVLGLTVKCARCHSHKFDPIPQRDYYRLAATFKGALDEHDWMAPRTKGPDQPEDAVPALLPGGTADEIAAWQAAGGKPEDRPMIRAAWDRGEPSPTYVLRRGNYLTPGTLVGPGVPSVLTDGQTPFVVKPPWPNAKTTGRRLALARWVTEKDHPLTSRVLVNRVWKHHFGEGIVKTLDNLGKMGALPTHPELLDWLAVYFVEHDWSVKALHRLMMNSAVYRQSSQVTVEHQRLDPENVWLSRMPLKRMEGEVLRDSLLAVAGRLDPTPFGRPDTLDVGGDGLVTAKSDDRRWRRSIFVLKRRTQPLTILQSFDVAGMDPNCIERRESIVAPQALHLKNNALVRELAKSFAARLWNEVGDDPTRQVRAAYRLAAGRDPSSREMEISLAALRELGRQWARHDLGLRHELTATSHLWVRESQPEVVYENDLVSVWSKASGDGGRRVGVLEFDLAELTDLNLKHAYLELGTLNAAALSQSAVVVPPGIEGIDWSRFATEKQTQARPLARLGRLTIPAGAGPAVGTYLRTEAASPEDMLLLREAIAAGGKLAIALLADEDGVAYRQDWDDGVHGSTQGKPPRLVVYEDRLDGQAVRRRALENLCHALFNSAAFLYID